MGVVTQTKPELAYLQTLKSLKSNPAQPLNIKQDPIVFKRLMERDMKAAWELTTDPSVPGKNPPSLPSANPGINKVRRFYKYEKPYCDEDVDDCTTKICDVDGSTEETTGYLAMDINMCASKSWTVGVDEFNSLLENPSERRADKIRRAAYALQVDANRKTIQNLYSHVSDYADGTSGLTATKTVTIISDKGDVLPVGMSKIKREYRESRFNGNHVIFGGEVAAQYFDVREMRLSPEGKEGLSGSMSNLPFLYDYELDIQLQALAADTASHGLVVPVGSYFVDTWNEFEGYKRMIDDNYVYTTMIIDGVKYDYSMVFDHCDKVWKEMLTLHYGLGGIPDEVYCDGNGLIRHFIMGCGPADCSIL